MTIADLAKDLGVSTRTIYRRVERAGLKIADMRTEDGQLTSDGAQTLAALFDTIDRDNDCDRQRHDAGQHKAKTTKTDEPCHALALELAEVKAKLEGLERENVLLRQMLEKAETTAADWKDQAVRAQQLHAAQIQLLPERTGIWKRIKNTFTGTKAEEKG